MTKRILAFCFVCATLTILSARPAQALFVTPVSDTTVQMGNQFMNVEGSHCDGLVQTSYLQRMKIGGHWMWIPTNLEYAAGKRDVVPQFTCSDGTIVYADATCSCLESVMADSQFSPTYDRLNQVTPLQLVTRGLQVYRGESADRFSTSSRALAAENRRRQLLFSTVRT